jgi:MoaA/NifB/PqqE/SkfB family radical SAM enzyme
MSIVDIAMANGLQRKFLKRFVHNRISKRKLPFFGSVEATRRCNSRCAFCPIGSERPELKKGEMTTEQFKEVIDQFAEFDLIITSFLGGEPTLRKDFAELGTYTKDAGMISQAVTNGITLADHAEEYTNSIDNLVVSLDTLDPQKYHDLRGADKYDEVVDGLKEAIKVSKGNECVVAINTVICFENLEEVPALVKYAKEIGAGGIMLDFATFHEEWKERKAENSNYDPDGMDWRRNPKGVQKLVGQLIEMKKEYPIMTSRSYLKTFQTSKFEYTCYPYLFCCVGRKGEIAIPCWDSPYTKMYPLLNGQRLKDLWFQDEVVKARDKVKGCSNCYMHCIVEPSKVVGEPFHNIGDLIEWVNEIRKHKKAFKS